MRQTLFPINHVIMSFPANRVILRASVNHVILRVSVNYVILSERSESKNLLRPFGFAQGNKWRASFGETQRDCTKSLRSKNFQTGKVKNPAENRGIPCSLLEFIFPISGNTSFRRHSFMI